MFLGSRLWFDVFNSGSVLCNAICIVVALFLFYKNEFDSENPNKAVDVIAIIIKLSVGGFCYIRTVVPNTCR